MLRLSLPLGVVLAASLVWHGSQAAFTSQTQDAGNQWTSARLTLTDDDAGSARFLVDGIVPGQSGQQCLTVTATATAPGVVRLYVSDFAASPTGLHDHLLMRVEQGSGGSFASCVGFEPSTTVVPDHSLAWWASTLSSWSTGADSWAVPGSGVPQGRSYRFTWVFDTTGLTQLQTDQLQGATTGLTLAWQMTSD